MAQSWICAIASLAGSGGTSGIIIDNAVGTGTMAGSSQVYFSTHGNQATRPVEPPEPAVAPYRHRNRHYNKLKVDTRQGSPMAMNDLSDLSSDNPSARATKKPYEKPAFRYEQVFVTTALSCEKISITQVNCTSTTLKAS
jgi:hypothetical protein